MNERKRSNDRTSEISAAKKRKQNLKKQLRAPPTIEEINQINLLDSKIHGQLNVNLYYLQINEVINANKLPKKYSNAINIWLDDLINLLSQLDSHTERKPLNELHWLKSNKNIKIPINLSTLQQSKFTFQFYKPACIFITGSYRHGTVIYQTPFIIDVCIEMPATTFFKDNYLNLIYHQQRAIYLAFISMHIQKWKHATDCQYTYFQNNKFKPILQIVPDGLLKNRVHFNLHVTCEEKSFKLSRFIPSKSNVRQHLFAAKAPDEITKQSEPILLPTPHYNSSILMDMIALHNDKFIEMKLNESSTKTYRNALILLKIWLRKLNFSNGYGKFTSYHLTMFMVYLIEKKIINHLHNVYKIIQTLWIQLGNSEWDTKGITLSNNTTTDMKSNVIPNQPNLLEFHQFYQVVFIDSTGFLNICSDLSVEIYQRIKYESQRAVQLFNQNTIENFRLLFCDSPLKPYLQYDHIIKINTNFTEFMDKYVDEPNLYDYCGYWYPCVLQCILPVLRKGLTNRYISMTPFKDDETIKSTWKLNEICPSNDCIENQKVYIGLILHPENAFNLMDKGPQANQLEAFEFRKFWGNKSELRRFGDGDVMEACAWGTKDSSLMQRRLICKDIVLHLLEYHFQINNLSVEYIGSELDVSYQVDELMYLFEDAQNNSENLSLPIIHTFNEISKCVRSLPDMPLNITSILGTSPVFRYCELFPIMNNSSVHIEGSTQVFQSYKINECILTFAVSGKWPNDLGAIERLKTAFYLKLSTLLCTQSEYKCRVNVDSLDVIKDGYMFRFRIALPKEIQLFKKEITTKGVVKYRDTPDSLRLERNLLIMPKITTALHSLYQKYTCFGPIVLIAKRWFNSQLIDSYLFPDICIEFLIAIQFLNKFISVTPPFQPQLGFIRFLHMLTNTDWSTELFILNFNELLSSDEIENLQTKFLINRKQFSNLCIITSFDTQRTGMWSTNAPTIQILKRISLLARNSLELIDKQINCDSICIIEQKDKLTTKCNKNETLLKCLFFPSYDGYNIIINLRKNYIHSSYLYDFARTTKRKQLIDKNVPAAEFNPVQIYLHELREAYDDLALFFYDSYGGTVIGVVWKPIVFQEFNEDDISDLSSNTMLCCRVSENDGKLYRNIEQILEDFRFIGNELIDTIINNKNY